jgi:hypothetical protein
VARLYPQALGSLFIDSYDSQGYGILSRLHAGLPPQKSLYNLRDDPTEKPAYHILLLYDVDNGADRIENTVTSGIPIGYVAWRDVFFCCIIIYCAVT